MQTQTIAWIRWLLAGGLGLLGLLVLAHPSFAIFDTTGFPPRWYCGTWTRFHGWTHILSDIAVWGAYTMIPVLIVYFVRKRKDIVFPKVFWLFAAFILACGTVHLVESMIFWWPAYRLLAVVKFITACASWATVIALIPVLPKALAIPNRMADIQSLIANAPIAMLVADQRGQILMVNTQVEALFGYDSSELIGRPVDLLVPRTLRGRHPTLVDSFFRNPKVTQLGDGRELYGCHRDGHEIPVEIGLTPLTLNERNAVMACIVNQTIRKQRREKELTELGHVLSLGEVVGGLAHELNTPIQRIVTWAGVMQLENAPEQFKEPIQKMTQAAKEAGKIVHQLRDAVIRRSSVDQMLDFNEIIRNTVSLMHREVTGIRTELAEDLPQVSGDPIEFQLVLSNLIRNAYQAGGPVAIATRVQHGYVVCSVDDSGPGFDVEPKRLFDPFFTTKSNGLGMGLTITQAIVRRYGGKIAAYKKDGGGARFEFTLPVN